MSKGGGVSFRGDANILKLIGVMVVHLNILKNHWIVQFKWVNGTVCEVSLNKVIIKKKHTEKGDWQRETLGLAGNGKKGDLLSA